MGMSVYIERTHTADTFTAVVVEYSGFLDQKEEEALEKARQMQNLTKTVRNTPEQTMALWFRVIEQHSELNKDPVSEAAMWRLECSAASCR